MGLARRNPWGSKEWIYFNINRKRKRKEVQTLFPTIGLFWFVVCIFIVYIYIVPPNADTTMQVFLAQKRKSVFIQNQPQFGKFLNKDLNLIRIKIE